MFWEWGRKEQRRAGSVEECTEDDQASLLTLSRVVRCYDPSEIVVTAKSFGDAALAQICADAI